MQQRSADSYLQVLRLAEQEAQWLDACLHNFGLDNQDLYYGAVERIVVPKPAVTDRATASAVIAAFGSVSVTARHAEWRTAADAFSEVVNNIIIGFSLSGDPRDTASVESMKALTDDLQPRERAARRALAEAVASELGHR